MKPGTGHTRPLFLAAGAAFLLTLLASAPASLLRPLIGGAGSVTGISGTLWQGSARAATFGTVRCSDFRWRLRPLSLLAGRLAASIEADIASGFVRGDVEISVTGRISVSELQLSGQVADLAPGMASLAGTALASAEIRELGWSKGWIDTAIGTVRLAGILLGVPGGPPAANARGNFMLEFDAPSVAADQPLVGDLSDESGPLEVDGSVELTAPANYQVNATLKAKPEAPEYLVRALPGFGPPTGDGGHSFSMAGSF